METATLEGAPKAQRFANYNGDCRDVIGQRVGPNVFGEPMTAVEATYDSDTNKTRVGFAFGQVGNADPMYHYRLFLGHPVLVPDEEP